MNEPRALILLPRLQIQNANAVSGPLTWGFPSPTAFTGFVHALQRRLTDEFQQGFGGVGIVCHKFEPQVSRPAGKHTKVFQLTRNPLGKDGKTAAITEEGRVHMEVSLLFTLYDSVGSDQQEYLAFKIMEVVHTMRLAGGSILPQRQGKRYEAQLTSLSPSQMEQDKTFRKLRRQLLPGFALVQREDRLEAHLIEMRESNSHATALDALLDLTRLNIEPGQANPDKPDETQWTIHKNPGWLVPIPVGYAAISPIYKPGEVLNTRDAETPFRFVENLYSLGEWISPHRLTTLGQLLWHYQTETEHGIYCCINHYPQYQQNISNDKKELQHG